MKIIIDIGHPAHVHLFKNAIWELEKRGHEIVITTRNTEIILNLLNTYGFEYIILYKPGKNLFGLAVELIMRDYKFFNLARQYKPDILIGVSEIITHIGKVLNIRSIVFTDTEHAKLSNTISFPFADVICTPSCYKGNIGKKQVIYNGYHELAYLHPKYFTPNPDVLKEIGLSKDDTFIILRFVSWKASHDVGYNGLSLEIKRKAVNEFKKYGKVLITSERSLPREFEKYLITVSLEKMHDLLYYATLLYGESATMASECAVLGTHAIFCDFAGRGYTDEEEEKYRLVYNFKLDNESQENSLKKAIELLEDKNLRAEGKRKMKKILKDKIDVTAFMIQFVENYPRSYMNALKS